MTASTAASSRRVAGSEVAPRPVPPRRRASLLAGLMQTARPKQWVKNLLVFAAVGASGSTVLGNRDVVLRVGITFGAFCLAASGTYFLNDALDVQRDRNHPTKRNRPIAAGIIPTGVAYMVAVGALFAAVAVPVLWVNGPTAVALAVYVSTTTIYSLWLKHVPILDIVLVAAGFVIRAVAGATAAEVPISDWFLIVTSFGSLFVVVGKRYAEFAALGNAAGSHRKALDGYSTEFLGHVRTTASAVTIVAYCLWAFERAAASDCPICFQLSIAPFIVALYRYAMLLEDGKGGAPEDLILKDRFFLGAFACWLVVFTLGVYVGG